MRRRCGTTRFTGMYRLPSTSYVVHDPQQDGAEGRTEERHREAVGFRGGLRGSLHESHGCALRLGLVLAGEEDRWQFGDPLHCKCRQSSSWWVVHVQVDM